jgi:DNA-binding CsgD family transcriptional regulator
LILIAFVRRNESRLLTLGLIIIALVTAGDILIDIQAGLPYQHLIHEITIMIFCLVLVSFQTRTISKQKLKISKTEAELIQSNTQRDEFRRKSHRFSHDFATVVEEQFKAWDLTESEKEIAILLIQGMSMKEIADDRQSKESTVRQQSASIYRKSHLDGRQQLSSYFLEDLFSPIKKA